MASGRFRAVLAIVAVTVVALAASANAVIILDSTYTTGSKVPPGGATGTYTIAAADQSSAGFDPGSSDKLVVVVGSRRDRDATHWINGATYGGVPLIEAVQQRSGNSVEETTGIYYLDSPSGLGDLVVSLNARAWADDSGIAMLGLSGTAPGVAASSGAIGTSTTLNIPVNDTIVIAGSENLTNTGTPAPQSPLISLGSNHLGSGYQFAPVAGTVTPTFSGTGATSVAAAFQAATGGPGPVGPLSISFDTQAGYGLPGGGTNNVPVGEPDNDVGLKLPGQVGPWNSLLVGNGQVNHTFWDTRTITVDGVTFTWNPAGEGFFTYYTSVDDLRGTVAFLRATGNTSIDWELIGLEPGAKYDLILFGQEQGSDGNAVNPSDFAILGFDAGNGIGMPVTLDAENDGNFVGVIASPGGLIQGTMSVRPGEGYAAVAGLQLMRADVIPEPATLSLLGLGALLALRRRRRSR